jgi:hypothetical protein
MQADEERPMDKRALMGLVCAVVATAREVGGPVPLVLIYLALDSDHTTYATVTTCGERMGWWTMTVTHLTLTARGQEVGELVNKGLMSPGRN